MRQDIYTVLVSKMLFLQELGPELGLSGLKCGRSVLGRCWCTIALRSVYLMSKVYLSVSGPKWVETLMTQVNTAGEWTDLGREFAD